MADKLSSRDQAILLFLALIFAKFGGFLLVCFILWLYNMEEENRAPAIFSLMILVFVLVPLSQIVSGSRRYTSYDDTYYGYDGPDRTATIVVGAFVFLVLATIASVVTYFIHKNTRMVDLVEFDEEAEKNDQRRSRRLNEQPQVARRRNQSV